jgi:hypothetical protein
MTATTVAPSVIEGIDMESVPVCERAACGQQATLSASNQPCGHSYLQCDKCLQSVKALLRLSISAGGTPRCWLCEVPLVEPYITVRPL